MRFTMLSSPCCVTAALLVLLMIDSAAAIPSPCASANGCHAARATCPPGSTVCPSSETTTASTSSSIFGVARTTATAIPRGGAVLEPDNANDVDAAILRASGEGKLVVIDFSATWCGPCKMIAPLFHELSDAMPEVVFVKIDVDENPDTAAKYNVSAMPTFLFIKEGEVVDRLMGANPARLQELIDEHK